MFQAFRKNFCTPRMHLLTWVQVPAIIIYPLVQPSPQAVFSSYFLSIMLLFRPTTSMTFRLVIGTTVIDQVVVPALGPDQSYARTSDGGPTWQITAAPTIDASNGTAPVTPVSQGGGGSGSSTATPTTPTSAIASGTQPAWSKLQLPAATATISVPTTSINPAPTTLITPGSSSTAGLDTGRRIALTLIVIVLILVLFACWKWKLYKFRS